MMQPYEEEDQDSYQEANTGMDNILPGDLDNISPPQEEICS